MTSLAVNHEVGIFRPEANFSPSLWGNIFSYPTRDKQVSENNIAEIETLKEEVKHMIISSDTTDKIYLIDTIERLGISYHFREEIEDQLSKMFDQNVIHEEDDLYKVSLYFRLFRQHGYPISSEYFNQFKDNNGEFEKNLLTDAKGLLSLYEAAHVRIHGDDILEESLTFATSNLERIIPTLDSTLQKQVTHALMQSLHRGIPRAEAHFNISIYEGCGSRNEKLLRLAKLDYNLLQVLHKEELSELTLWWIDLNFASKLSYVRDVMVECFFWAARIILAKCIAMIYVIDDTYDSYVDQLPYYMKTIYTSLLDLFNDYEMEVGKQDRFNGIFYVKEAMKEIIRSYYIEAKWFIGGDIPSFKEYMSNALITGTYYLLIEKEKGQLVTGIECYMEEHNLSVEEASEKLSEIAENAWKDLNKECIKPTSMPSEILLRVVNLTRLIDVVYKNNQDGYSDPKNNVKSVIEALLVNPINL
ncbi:unnamed protein product [Withania somnifera]